MYFFTIPIINRIPVCFVITCFLCCTIIYFHYILRKLLHFYVHIITYLVADDSFTYSLFLQYFMCVLLLYYICLHIYHYDTVFICGLLYFQFFIIIFRTAHFVIGTSGYINK
jgi:hypothetical protein